LETVSNTDATRVRVGSQLWNFNDYFKPRIENAQSFINGCSSISTTSKAELVKQLQDMIDAGISTSSPYHNFALLELREVDGLLQTLHSVEAKYPDLIDDKKIDFVWNAVRKAAGTGRDNVAERVTTANLTATIPTSEPITDIVDGERVANKTLEFISKNVWSGAFGNTYKNDKAQRIAA
jgi:hypothetical protein